MVVANLIAIVPSARVSDRIGRKPVIYASCVVGAAGLLIAAFFHALNLALAAFSPMIQALRLHYVEFFSKFVIGGGRPFRPFGWRPENTSAESAPSPRRR